MSDEKVALRLGIPFPKQAEFLLLNRKKIGKRGQLDVSQNHWVGGRGTAKTTTGLILLLKAVSDMPNLRGYWSEGTHADIERIFMPALRKHVPKELWKHKEKKSFQWIEWWNGHCTDLLSREVKNKNSEVGIGSNYCYGIDDEAAAGFDKRKVSSMHNAIREPLAPYLFHDTVSTPRRGPYVAWRAQKGAVTIRSCSFDNPYISMDVIESMIESMSPEMVRQEIYGEDINLSGAIWKSFEEKQWPAGNIMEGAKFDPSKPFYFSFDLGSNQSAAQVIQYMDPVHEGRRMFNGRLAVIVAELTPNAMGLPALVVHMVERYCGGYDQNRMARRNPVKVYVGHDIKSGGTTFPGSSTFASLGWEWETPRGAFFGKDMQRQSASAIILNNAGERRFCVAANKGSDGVYRIADQQYGEGKNRGILNVMRNDEYPDPKSKEVFNKDKTDLGVDALEDDRDAWLYWVVCAHPIGFGAGAFLGLD